VDIRRKVVKVYIGTCVSLAIKILTGHRFNREEEDFDSLKDYNNYLNDVEDITFNLINNIDVEPTERKLKEYEEANRQAITNNLQRAKQGAQSVQARQAAERELARLKRQAAIREEEEDRRERDAARRDLLEKLASGVGDAEELARQSEMTMLNRAKSRKQALANDLSALENANGSATFLKGLKKQVEAEPEVPYDPFGGASDKREYFVIQDDYGWDFFDKLKEPHFSSGGYDVHEYYTRALCETFSGLGVIVGDDLEGAAPASVATAAAEMITTSRPKLMVDDVF